MSAPVPSAPHAVALIGEPDGGWVVEAHVPRDALAVVRGTCPRAGEVSPGECLAWAAGEYRDRFLLGGDFGPEWTRL